MRVGLVLTVSMLLGCATNATQNTYAELRDAAYAYLSECRTETSQWDYDDVCSRIRAEFSRALRSVDEHPDAKTKDLLFNIFADHFVVLEAQPRQRYYQDTQQVCHILAVLHRSRVNYVDRLSSEGVAAERIRVLSVNGELVDPVAEHRRCWDNYRMMTQ